MGRQLRAGHGRALPRVAASLLAVVAAWVAAPGSALAARGSVRPLSNEWTRTVWAYGLERAVVRAAPRPRARPLGRVALENGNGFPEIYVVLARASERTGREWLRIRLAGRPNGRTGWVRRDALGSLEVTHWLIRVNLAARRLTAFFDGRVRLRAPVGIGKPSTPTPTGHFWITERIPINDRADPYWPYVLGTSDYSTLTDWPGGGVVGIHGDFGEPGRIPGDPSHGCIRMLDPDVTWLARHVSLGTPVVIVAG